ncbi:hypothetical protein GLOIN_2v1652170 [Rhizophagus irregularis DAOM 181602=DAOM 197198]|nr:hypothetical protein GLOIN_2v1652170 [Rhizophagus irregularis DAOM 181602=DAOM 197198]
MSSELELLKQRITELEAENVEITELRKENAELRKENTDFRMKFANFEAERAELKRKIAETLRMTEKERTRRDAENVKLRATIEELRKNNTKESAELRDRITKVEQNQSLNDNSSNNSLPSFNSVADQVPTVTHHEKPLVDTSLPKDKETDAFLDEEYKKKVSNEIRQRNREKKLCFSTSGQTQESLPTHPEEKMSQDLNSVTQPCNSTSSEEKICSELDSKCKKGKSVDKLKQELFASELSSQEPSIEQNHVTEISEALCPEKVTSDKSSIDEASQHLAQLCDKAFDAEDKANRANQEEILCWYLYAKDFIIQLNGIIESSGGKFGEKKARGLLYDSITKQLNLLRKQRSQEMGLQLRDVSRDSLRKKTQRAEKVYKFIEQVDLDKIKYIKSYSATSISELTNEQIQDIIDYGISSEKLPLVTDHVTEISETLCPRKNLPENTPDQNNVLEVLSPKESTALIPLAHPSNSSDNSKEEEGSWFDENMFFNEANPTKVNITTSDDDDSNSSDSEEEMPDDDGYNGYGGYNEYGECDRGYYYHDGRYERKSSPMMNPIISPVTA